MNMSKMNLGEVRRLETGTQAGVNVNCFLRKWRVGEIPTYLGLNFERCIPQLFLLFSAPVAFS